MTDIAHSIFDEPRHRDFVTFNRNDGYIEAIVRGMRGTILSQGDYANLCQCESLDDMKVHLSQSDYADVLQNESGPITSATFRERWFVFMLSFIFKSLF